MIPRLTTLLGCLIGYLIVIAMVDSDMAVGTGEAVAATFIPPVMGLIGALLGMSWDE